MECYNNNKLLATNRTKDKIILKIKNKRNKQIIKQMGLFPNKNFRGKKKSNQMGICTE